MPRDVITQLAKQVLSTMEGQALLRALEAEIKDDIFSSDPLDMARKAGRLELIVELTELAQRDEETTYV